MKVKIDIETKVFIRLLLVVIGFGLALIVLYKIRSALVLLAGALFIALALNPPVSKLAKTLPGNSRIGATAIAYLIVISLLGGFLVMVVPPVIEQSSHFASTVPSLIDDLSKNRDVFDDFINRYNLESAVDSAIEGAKAQASAVATNLGNLLVSGAGTILSGLASMVIMLVLAFLMLIEGPTWLGRLWGLYNNQANLNRHRTLVKKMYKVVTGFVNGQLTVASIASISVLVVMLAMSVMIGSPANLAIPLAVVIFFTNMVPMIGSTIGGALVSLVLLFNAPTAAVVFLIYFLIYQQIENNFIAPVIQSKTVDLSALLIITAILVGGSFGGLLGALIAIPVAGCIKVLWMDQLEHTRKQRQVTSKNPLKKLAKSVKA